MPTGRTRGFEETQDFMRDFKELKQQVARTLYGNVKGKLTAAVQRKSKYWEFTVKDIELQLLSHVWLSEQIFHYTHSAVGSFRILQLPEKMKRKRKSSTFDGFIGN